MNAKKFRKAILRMVERVGETFRSPDDDWLPTLFLLGGDGGMTVAGVACPKEQFAAAVAAMFAQVKPERAAFVMSAWAAEVKEGNPVLRDLAVEMNAAFGVRNNPNRREVLMVEVADPSGTETYQAPILRSKDRPPALGEWKRMEGEASGRLVNVLARAFAAMKGG